MEAVVRHNKQLTQSLSKIALRLDMDLDVIQDIGGDCFDAVDKEMEALHPTKVERMRKLVEAARQAFLSKQEKENSLLDMLKRTMEGGGAPAEAKTATKSKAASPTKEGGKPMQQGEATEQRSDSGSAAEEVDAEAAKEAEEAMRLKFMRVEEALGMIDSRLKEHAV
ncbi:unnamed protein product, partial [Symbiodinium sp. KB8]